MCYNRNLGFRGIGFFVLHFIASANGKLSFGSAGLGFNTLYEKLSEFDPVTLYNRKLHPDINLPAVLAGLIVKAGYPVESHELTTEDGYILTIHRIPGGRNTLNTSVSERVSGIRPVVILQHSILASSDDWLLNGPQKSLAFLLADEGYDVWLMNSRGNKYSRKHLTLSPLRMRFWQFGFHEQGLYDLAAVIDTALNRTGQSSVYFVGHGLAAAKVLVLLSVRPDFNQKIRLASLMAPTVFGNNMRSPLRFLGPFTFLESFILDLLGYGELIPSFLVQLMSQIAPKVCTPVPLAASVCESPIYLFAGFDSAQANYTQLPVILGHRTSTSTRTFIHFVQTVVSPTFRQYDYGIARNRRNYNGQSIPPDYSLKNANTSFALYHSENDLLADQRDVARLAQELDNVMVNGRIENSRWNHIDYLFGIDAPKLVYERLIADMKRV